MNYKKISLFALLSCMLLIGCKEEKKESSAKDFLRPPSMAFTANDSAQIHELVAKYIEAYAQKDFDATADMLYKVENDSVYPLSDAEKAKYKKAMSILPVYGVKEESFSLQSNRNNDIRLMVQIISSGSLEEAKGVTHVSLNPVLQDGKWYLTMRDEKAEGVENMY